MTEFTIEVFTDGSALVRDIDGDIGGSFVSAAQAAEYIEDQSRTPFTRKGDTITKVYEVTITRYRDAYSGFVESEPNPAKHLEDVYRRAANDYWFRITDMREVR